MQPGQRWQARAACLAGNRLARPAGFDALDVLLEAEALFAKLTSQLLQSAIWSRSAVMRGWYNDRSQRRDRTPKIESASRHFCSWWAGRPRRKLIAVRGSSREHAATGRAVKPNHTRGSPVGRPLYPEPSSAGHLLSCHWENS